MRSTIRIHNKCLAQSLSSAMSCAILGAVLLGMNATTAIADQAVAWGPNNYGQLGTTAGDQPTPTPVTDLDSGVTSVAASPGMFNTSGLGEWGHSLAVQNGAAFAWGYNEFGQLGNGTTGTNSNVPVPVAGLGSGVTTVDAGIAHSLAIQNGAAFTWGRGWFGLLGNGTTNIDSNIPVPVTGLDSGVTAVAAGYVHSLAIQNGAAFAWGDNSVGELGNGTFTNSNVPVPVTGLESGVTSVATGGSWHNLAIQNGAAFAWGDGYLGNGTSGVSNIPVPVTGLNSGVSSIAVGYGHSLAIQNGDVYAWGLNNFGQLGNGTQVDSSTPLLALDLDVDLVQVAAGGLSSYALSSDGSLWVWGDNDYGGLGIGDFTDRLTPTQLLPPDGFRFTSIDGGGRHAVATLSAVPEPRSASALLVATAGMLFCRRHRAKSKFMRTIAE